MPLSAWIGGGLPQFFVVADYLRSYASLKVDWHKN
jgi:hypothetical protein